MGEKLAPSECATLKDERSARLVIKKVTRHHDQTAPLFAASFVIMIFIRL